MDNRTVLIILNLIPGLGPVGIGNLIDKFKEPRTILETSENELKKVTGLRRSVLENITCWEKIVDIERELALIREKEIRIITILDDEYPFYLKNIHSPPAVLYIKAGSSFEFIPSIAVVGTRKASPYGEKITKELSMELSQRGFIIVSGMA
ncbi:DNA-processing protein DprA, partial [bacterium]|nr:DNA-processing protein DprA [bacterium]